MKKILQARVNVLIQQNRQLQQKKQREKLLNLKQKNSYSLYQEPSKHKTTLPRQSKFNYREQSVCHLSYKQYATQDIEQIYRTRFNQLQSKTYQKIPIEELYKEQHYYNKVIEGLTKKIDKLAIKTINHRLAQLNTSNINSTHLSRHKSSMIVQKQNLEGNNNGQESRKEKESGTSNKTQLNMIAHEQSLNSQRIDQLNRQYAHLEQQISKFRSQQNHELNLEKMKLDLDKDSIQVTRAIKDRKAEISQLRLHIAVQTKQLEKGQQDISTVPDNIEQIKGAIYKIGKQNKNSSERLANIQQKNQQIISKIRQLQVKKDQIMPNVPEQTKESIATAETTIKTPKNVSKSPKSFKIKHLTTLDVQSQQQYLLKKKEVLLKSIQTQNKKWKSIYTQKMKKLVNEYFNQKQMQSMSCKLEQRKKARLKQLEYLKQKNSLNEVYD